MCKTTNILILLAVFALVCACHAKRENRNDGEDNGSNKAVRIAYVPTLDALPLFVAKDMGWLAEQNVEVELVKFLAQMDVDTALVGGSVDGAFTDKVRVRHLKEKFDLHLDILATTPAEWALVSNKAARLTQLDQFGDKMVATTRFSATDSLTDLAFRGIKTSAPMFKVQINDVELRLRMIDNNEMDAAWLPEPYATRAQLLGHKKILDSSQYETGFGVLVLRDDFAKTAANEQRAQILARVYSMACDSLDKYGIEAYAHQLHEYCGIDSIVVNHLPNTKFKK